MKFYDSEQKLVKLSDIHLGYNPRSNIGDLSSLKQSIQQIGLLEPVILRPNGNKTKEPYELVCGHRRFLSFKELNYLQIPSVIRNLTDEESFHMAFIDNQERENHNPIDEARHYKIAQDRYGYSTRDLLEKYGGDHHSFYARKLNLLDLPLEIQDKLSHQCDKITETHCIHICKLVNKKELIKRFEELFDLSRDKWDEEQQKRFAKTK